MKISFCGDCIIKDEPTDIEIGCKLKDILGTCEINAINLEAPIDTRDSLIPIQKAGPNHKQSIKTPQWLEKNGFNLISLANNHSLDYGSKALLATVNSFKKSLVIGYGTYPEAYEFNYISNGDETIGFLALSHREFGCIDIHSKEKIGTPIITSPLVFRAIKEARQKANKLIIISHTGVEYIDAPLPEWRELFKTFIDMGVDMIVNSHPHIPQGVEIYKGKPIIYSLGNFIFDKPNTKNIHPLWYSSILTIFNSKNNKIDILPLKYDIQKKLIEIDTSIETKNHLNYLNNLINCQSTYNSYISKLYPTFSNIYKQRILSGTRISIKENIKNLFRLFAGKKLIRKNEANLLNLFQCESHRWIIQRQLHNNLESNKNINEK